MSAFLCSDRHTVTLAVYACERGLSDDVVQAAIQLRALNNTAMSTRYPSRDCTMPLAAISAHVRWAHRRVLGMQTLADPWVHALTECFAYQCDEAPQGEDNPQHLGAKLAQNILATARKLSGGSKPPNVWALANADEDDDTGEEVQS